MWISPRFACYVNEFTGVFPAKIDGGKDGLTSFLYNAALRL
jgi:hypothetical protein